MQLVTVDQRDAVSENACARSLEQGDILFFPATPFELPTADQDFLRSLSGLGAAHHKNVAYKPALDKVSGFGSGDGARLQSIFRAYSQRVIEFMGKLLPRYKNRWKVD